MTAGPSYCGRTAALEKRETAGELSLHPGPLWRALVVCCELGSLSVIPIGSRLMGQAPERVSTFRRIADKADPVRTCEVD